MNIARVGVTAKVIDVKTGKIQWVGFASVADVRLQEGSKRVVEAMLDHSWEEHNPELQSP